MFIGPLHDVTGTCAAAVQARHTGVSGGSRAGLTGAVWTKMQPNAGAVAAPWNDWRSAERAIAQRGKPAALTPEEDTTIRLRVGDGE